jgi:hypothetical protein
MKGIEKYVTIKSALFFHHRIYDVIFTNQFLICLKRGRTEYCDLDTNMDGWPRDIRKLPWPVTGEAG